MEFYRTPFDFAAFDRPKNSKESVLKENELVGISWIMIDFDGKQCESFMNLSPDFRMISNASYLCTFRLMPLETTMEKPIEANWKFNVVNKEKRIIQFYDNSVGKITKWHWDFGDGAKSEEQNPVPQYKSSNVWTVKLTVEKPSGKSFRSKVWEVVTK